MTSRLDIIIDDQDTKMLMHIFAAFRTVKICMNIEKTNCDWNMTVWRHTKAKGPTEHFGTLEPHDPSIRDSELRKVRRLWR